MAFKETMLSVDLHNRTAIIAFQKQPEPGRQAIFVNIQGMPFEEAGPHTEEEQKQKVMVHARRVLEELLADLPVE